MIITTEDIAVGERWNTHNIFDTVTGIFYELSWRDGINDSWSSPVMLHVHSAHQSGGETNGGFTLYGKQALSFWRSLGGLLVGNECIFVIDAANLAEGVLGKWETVVKEKASAKSDKGYSSEDEIPF